MRSPIGKSGAIEVKSQLLGIVHSECDEGRGYEDVSGAVGSDVGVATVLLLLTGVSAVFAVVDTEPRADMLLLLSVVDAGVCAAILDKLGGGAGFPTAFLNLTNIACKTPLAAFARGFLSCIASNLSVVQWKCCMALPAISRFSFGKRMYIVAISTTASKLPKNSEKLVA